MATETLAPAEGVGAGLALPTPILQAQAVSKQFPGVLALDQVDFELRAGEVHVLFGENGAGKSTLIQMLAGVHAPTAGSLRFRGEPLDLQGVHHARTLGISAVFQEFSLVPHAHRRGESVPRRRADEPRLPRQVGAASPRRRHPQAARLPVAAAPASPGSHPRRAADGRDRQGVPHRPLGADPRRADGLAHRSRERSACSR